MNESVPETWPSKDSSKTQILLEVSRFNNSSFQAWGLCSFKALGCFASAVDIQGFYTENARKQLSCDTPDHVGGGHPNTKSPAHVGCVLDRLLCRESLRDYSPEAEKKQLEPFTIVKMPQSKRAKTRFSLCGVASPYLSIKH